MVESDLEIIFPALKGRSYRITSPIDRRYNCIAFAAGDTQRWWWPDQTGEDYWPETVARAETAACFRDAFATFGYEVCSDDVHEPGFEKIALFALAHVPKHAARQLSNGRWTSKLGPRHDIEHDLQDLTGLLYGSVVFVMKRPLTN